MLAKIPHQPVLTFELLDDVLFQPLDEQDKLLAKATVQQIGPLTELICGNPPYSEGFIKQKNSPEIKALAQVVKSKTREYGKGNFSANPQRVEFFRTPQTEQEFEREEWIAFERRLEIAGKKAGLPNIFAKELTGTLGEMVSNLFTHSDRPDTGIVGYRWSNHEFEYVVADRGIGVLQSLRKHSDYADLIDTDQALLTALTEGESRFGRAARRGNGFNTLVLNIASRRSCLRFRSGGSAHVIDGRGIKFTRGSFTCAPYQGFLVSVLCLAD